MFKDFISQLPDALTDIEHNAENRRWEKLQHFIHRLHGAACYTGTPRLQHYCAECEKQLKSNEIEEALQYIPLIRETSDILIQQKVPEALKTP